MGEKITNPGGEQWLPSQTSMEAAYEYLNPSSEEAGNDHGLAARQYDLAAQADALNAADASGNFGPLDPGAPNPN